MWPFNKILDWIDRYFELQASRRVEEEEKRFQQNLENLWQKPEDEKIEKSA